MIVFAEKITPRLKYVAAFAGRQLYGADLQLTGDAAVFKAYTGAKINYSRAPVAGTELHIKPHGLLSQAGIRIQDIQIDRNDPLFRFFLNDTELGFDLFSALFYLVSRYEEYLPAGTDMYGRYAHTGSLAYRFQFLHLPLADQWLHALRSRLAAMFPHDQPLYHPQFKLQPTYDIDMAWSFRGRGWMRNMGGLFRSLFTGPAGEYRQRLSVLRDKTTDPFDSFNWLDQLHRDTALQPVYFFLLAGRPGLYDRNNDPQGKAMRELVQSTASKYPVGIHPSWRSGDEAGLTGKEKSLLESLAGKKITSSRQHYIRFRMPETFQQLLADGITDDYSMGYGSINGFRASTSFPHYWYDLMNETATSLRLHPFCFMDANSFYEQGQDAEAALQEMARFYERVADVGGTMIMIWHNHFLGTDPKFRGWNEIYKNFIQQVSTPGYHRQQERAISVRG